VKRGRSNSSASRHLGPTSLTALVSFGTTAYDATLGVDDSGLIDTLLFRPALGAAPTTWAAIDRHLSAIAPGVSFLAARLNANGTCYRGPLGRLDDAASARLHVQALRPGRAGRRHSCPRG
jgi:hypothetical protein